MDAGDNQVRSSIRDILEVLFRFKGRLLAVFLATVIVVTVVAYAIPSIYRSNAELLVRLGRDNLSVELNENDRATTMVNNRDTQESQINSEKSVLMSRTLIEKVVNTLGDQTVLRIDREGGPASGGWLARQMDAAAVALRLRQRLSDHEKAIQVVTENLLVRVPQKSNIVEVAFEAPDRGLAQRILETLLGFYMERHIEVNAASAPPSFFETQRDQAAGALANAEDELEAFRAAGGISSLKDQQQILLDQIRGIENEMEKAQSAARAAQKSIESMERMLEKEPRVIERQKVTGVHNFSLDPHKARLMELRTQEADLLSRYQDDYPGLQTVRNQMRSVEDLIAREENTHTQVTMGINENHQTLALRLQTERSQLASNENMAKSLAEMAAEKRRLLDGFSAQEIKLKALERGVVIAEEEYRRYNDNLHRARISTALDQVMVSNVKIVQPATMPLRPLRPNRPLIILLGVLLGLLGGVGVAYLSNYFDDTLNSDADVERHLGLPVLASISEAEHRAMGNVASEDFRSLRERFVELYQELRARLPEKRSPLLTFLGTSAEDGTAMTSFFFALTASQQLGRQVALIESDPGSPGLQGARATLADVIEQRAKLEEALAPSTGSASLHLGLLAAPGGVSRILSAPACTEVFDRLRSMYDAVVFDAPPYAASGDGLLIGSRTDGVILVVEAGKTRWQVAQSVRNRIASQGGTLLGIVLNKRKYYIPRKIYSRL